jgi:cell division protein FtsX
MRPYLIAGIVLCALGAFVLLRGASFASQRNVLSVGDLQITAEERQTVPPWAGGVALVAGVALIVVGARRRS